MTLFGAEISSVNTALATNFSEYVPSQLRFTQPTIQVQNATFCNVTVSYTHPGQSDNIVVETWLPIENPTWNSRLQAVGGGGWQAGRNVLSYETMKGAIGDGYATTTTDAGLGDAVDPADWALTSPGNVNLYKFNNFASVSLNDQAIISKALIKGFYGKGPDFSYWNGCSQGGRQGVMLAQRYPTAYDGISAGAPVIYMTMTGTGIYWPQEVMNELKAYPYGCEMDAISAAAVTACDGLDGVVDGIVSNPDTCLAKFDPFKVVGTPVPNCHQAGNRTVKISTAAATVVNATWRGMVTTKGARVWYGLPPGSPISKEGNGVLELPGIAGTNCSSGTCVGSPNYLPLSWFTKVLARGDPSFSLASMTHSQFDDMVHTGRQAYASIMDTDDPDLSRFRDAGGKMVTFHGLSDPLVPFKATQQYYDEVSALLPDAHNFYRHYQVPGLQHCFGGASGQPSNLFEQLRAWVENGTTPQQTPVDVTVKDGSLQHRIVCPYPQTATFDKKRCRDATSASCWSCTGRL